MLQFFNLIARLSPYIMYGYTFIFDQNLLFKMIGNDVFNIFLKYFFFILFPTLNCLKRPEDTAWIDTPGFPSGHSQQFFYLLLKCEQKRGFDLYSLSMLILFIIIAYSRIHIRCHNFLQIYGGVLFGTLYFIFIDVQNNHNFLQILFGTLYFMLISVQNNLQEI